MFSVMKATEKHVESHQRRKRPVFDMYAAAVISFVESYIEAKKIYPKVSEVVRGTGGSRSTIQRILDELNLDKNALRCKEVCVEGPDDMRINHAIHSVTECMPNNNINNKNSACPCSDEFEQLAPEVLSDQVELSTDSMDSETDTEQLVPEVVSAHVEVLTDGTDSEIDTEGIDISADNSEKKGHSGQIDPAFLTLFEQAMHLSSKADANRRLAPLMEVLQQKSSGSSRRVHLSASGGLENRNDLSWEKNLLSIMPTSVGGKEDTSGVKVGQPKVDRESIDHPSSFSKKSNESPKNASGLQYTVKLMSSKANSILSTLSILQLQNALRKDAKFKDLKKIKVFPRMGNTNAHAILQFKNYESMDKALKLKTITIVGEHFSVLEGLGATVDSIMEGFTQPAGQGKTTSVFQEVMQGMVGYQKKKHVYSNMLPSLTYSTAEGTRSDICMQAQAVSCASFSRIITIKDLPKNTPLESIQSFFSVFGKVQTSGGSVCNKPTVFVEFENESDKEKALKVQQFAVDGCCFVIRPDAPSDAVVVRLKSEQSEVNQKEVIRTCKKYGAVEKVFIRRSQAMDVHYAAEKRERIDELLNSLHKDEYLKGKWKISLVCDGYIKADAFDACHKPRVLDLVVSLRDLVTHLTKMLATKLETLNQLAADIESMSATKKVM